MWEATVDSRFDITFRSASLEESCKLCIRIVHILHKCTAVSYPEKLLYSGPAGSIPSSMLEASFHGLLAEWENSRKWATFYSKLDNLMVFIVNQLNQLGKSFIYNL